jgi:apolipoprotein D and lipocalin family protein
MWAKQSFWQRFSRASKRFWQEQAMAPVRRSFHQGGISQARSSFRRVALARPSSRASAMLPYFVGSLTLLSAAGISLALRRQRQRSSLKTAADIDLRQYAGIWCEIARLPTRFERRAVNVRATYTLLEDGNIEVLNDCELDGFQGQPRQVRGTARIVDKADPARLKVRFGLISADYWILEVGEHYEYAVVGVPDRSCLWILSRKPRLNHEVFQGILARMSEQGFDTEQLLLTPQEDHRPVRQSDKVTARSRRP